MEGKTREEVHGLVISMLQDFFFTIRDKFEDTQLLSELVALDDMGSDEEVYEDLFFRLESGIKIAISPSEEKELMQEGKTIADVVDMVCRHFNIK